MSPPTLPPELLTNIISHVDADTLPATRLVSKQFHTISTPFFGQKCLSSLAFMFSEHSLSHLVELTESKLIKSEEERKIDRRWEEYEREAEEEELRGELGLPPVREADEIEDERGDAIQPELRLEELLGERKPSPEERHRREEFRNNIQDEPSANSTTTTTAHKDRKPENTLTNHEVEEANVAAEALMTSYDKSKAMTNFLNSERYVELMSQAFKNLKTANVQVSLGFYDDTPQVIGQNKVLWAPYRKPHGFDEVYDGRLNHHVESPMMPDLRRLMPDLVYCSILQATGLADLLHQGSHSRHSRRSLLAPDITRGYSGTPPDMGLCLRDSKPRLANRRPRSSSAPPGRNRLESKPISQRWLLYPLPN
ncbi:hypothetical protein M438DRAFT_356161 [Aureobasidium pullulans EXF-150]|uniref:F-box domain-containing protein n=1 Tax=Aureobasidium pullulans EXF-150 TaxID=1043002 RepID=A0A074XDI0_AURPU|nr:uncharacterized protein M438DRAFT_356161 [Aureobasidium pullulans EXF-150]KEQ83473.1 hypothetical protein M438DRAFT_356161 [Aureobasidium pullulans EXF-150]